MKKKGKVIVEQPAAAEPKVPAQTPPDMFLTPAERRKKLAHEMLDDPRCVEFAVVALMCDGEFKTQVSAGPLTLSGAAAVFLRKAGALLGG
jgi:hypothetical protein